MRAANVRIWLARTTASEIALHRGASPIPGPSRARQIVLQLRESGMSAQLTNGSTAAMSGDRQDPDIGVYEYTPWTDPMRHLSSLRRFDLEAE